MTTPAQRAVLQLLESGGLRITTHIQSERDRPRPVGRPPRTYSTRELHEQILALAARGMRNYIIALELGITQSVVSKHRRGFIKLTRI